MQPDAATLVEVVVEHLPYETVHEPVPVERVRRFDQTRVVGRLECFGDVQVVATAHVRDEIHGELVTDDRGDTEQRAGLGRKRFDRARKPR